MEIREVLGGEVAEQHKGAGRMLGVTGTSLETWRTERWRKGFLVSKVRAVNGTEGGMRWHEPCVCVRQNVRISPICI